MAIKRAEPIGPKIDALWALREDKRKLEAQVSAIEEQIGVMEASILEQMDKEGTDKVSTTHASVSISENVVPVVKDWDEFIRYLIRTKQGHLVERRPSVPACRELFTLKGKIPGLEPFTKRKLNLRTIN